MSILPIGYVKWDGTKYVIDSTVNLAGPAGPPGPQGPAGIAVGPASGDLGGNYPNPLVVKLQGRNVSSTAPTNGQLLTWVAGNNDWEPVSAPSGFTAGGDLSGTSTNQNVINIHGASVPIAGSLTTGNVLQVTGASALSYSAINLAGGSNFVTGTLPSGNQASQTMGGDVTGTTASNTVVTLTGSAGIVSLPTSTSIKLDTGSGTFPASGLIRSKQYAGVQTLWEGKNAGGDAIIIQQSTNSLNLGDSDATAGWFTNLNGYSTTLSARVGATYSSPTHTFADFSGTEKFRFTAADPSLKLDSGSGFTFPADGYIRVPDYSNGGGVHPGNRTIIGSRNAGGDSPILTFDPYNQFVSFGSDTVTVGTHTFIKGYYGVDISSVGISLRFAVPVATPSVIWQTQGNIQNMNWDFAAATGNCNLRFGNSIIPTIKQDDLTTNSGTGATLTIQAQNETGATSVGGALVLQSGTGTSTNGNINFKGGSNTVSFIEGTHGVGTFGGSGTDGLVALGPRVSAPTASCLWLLANGGTPAGNNYTLFQTGGTDLEINSGGGSLYLEIAQSLCIQTNTSTTTLYMPTVQWNSAVVAPTLKQADKTTNSGTGETLTIRAQNETGTTSIGGALVLASGTGTSTHGLVQIEPGSIATVNFSPSGGTSLATTGTMRVAKDFSLYARNSTDASNAVIISLDGTNNIQIGDISGISSASLEAATEVNVLANSVIAIETPGTIYLDAFAHHFRDSAHADFLTITGGATSTFNLASGVTGQFQYNGTTAITISSGNTVINGIAGALFLGASGNNQIFLQNTGSLFIAGAGSYSTPSYYFDFSATAKMHFGVDATTATIVYDQASTTNSGAALSILGQNGGGTGVTNGGTVKIFGGTAHGGGTSGGVWISSDSSLARPSIYVTDSSVDIGNAGTGNLYLDTPLLHLRTAAGVSIIDSQLATASSYFEWTGAMTGDVTIDIAQNTAQNNGVNLILGAQPAKLSGSGNGGNLLLRGGARDGTGLKGGVKIQLNSTTETMFEAVAVVDGYRVTALNRGANLTSTQMPFDSGDLVTYIGNANIVPHVNPVSGVILYSDAGVAKIRQPDGTVVTIASSSNTISGDVTGTLSASVVSAISGSSPIAITPATLQWINTTATPTITQADRSASGNATNLIVRAQNATSSGNGGKLVLSSGANNGGVDGYIDFQIAGISDAKSKMVLNTDGGLLLKKTGFITSTAGDLNFGNSATVYFRNAASSQDLPAFTFNASNQVSIGYGNGFSSPGNLQLEADSTKSIYIKTTPTFQFANNISSPTIKIEDATNGSGSDLTVAAQKAVNGGNPNGSGGYVDVMGGAKVAGGTGIQGGVRLQLNGSATTMIETAEVVTGGHRITALNRGANITSTEMPTNTGDLVTFIGDTATAPTASAVSGGIMYSESGALKWRGSSGTTTTMGPAEPHCPVCGSDFVTEHQSDTYGYLSVCLKCLSDFLGAQPWIQRSK